MKRMTLVCSIVLALMAATSCSSSASASKDVSITACTTSATGGHPTAEGRILNHSSKTSAYAIHVKFVDAAGNGVGDGVAAVAKVEAGKTANWHADGSLDDFKVCDYIEDALAVEMAPRTPAAGAGYMELHCTGVTIHAHDSFRQRSQ